MVGAPAAPVTRYREALKDLEMLDLPEERSDCQSAWHLFVVRLRPDTVSASRAESSPRFARKISV